MNKLITTLLILAALLVPAPAMADETKVVEEITCTSVYGGGQICGIKTHEPVDADLGDVNPAVLGSALLLTSGALLFVSRKLKTSASILS